MGASVSGRAGSWSRSNSEIVKPERGEHCALRGRPFEIRNCEIVKLCNCAPSNSRKMHEAVAQLQPADTSGQPRAGFDLGSTRHPRVVPASWSSSSRRSAHDNNQHDHGLKPYSCEDAGSEAGLGTENRFLARARNADPTVPPLPVPRLLLASATRVLPASRISGGRCRCASNKWILDAHGLL